MIKIVIPVLVYGTKANPVNRQTHNNEVQPKYHNSPPLCPDCIELAFSRKSSMQNKNNNM